MMASSMTVAGGGNWQDKKKNNNNTTPMPGIDTSYARNTPGMTVTPAPTPANPTVVTNGASVSSPGLTPTNNTVAMEFEQYVDTTYAGNGMIVGGASPGAEAGGGTGATDTSYVGNGIDTGRRTMSGVVKPPKRGGDYGASRAPKGDLKKEAVDSAGGGESGGGDYGDGASRAPKGDLKKEVVDSTGGGDFGGGEVPKEEPEEEVVDSTGGGDFGGGEVPKEEPEEEVADSTGEGASGGGEVPEDDEPSYAESTDYLKEYYEGAEQREQEKRETSYEANAQIKESAIKTADASRDRAIVDARSSAELRESSYGANAEALAGMGLSSSGYKDYYDSVSYAQMREETQYANAQFDAAQRAAIEQETVANKEADLRYETNMDANAKEYAAYMQNKNNEDSATRTNNFNTAYNMVRNGDSVDSAVTWLASQGITLNDSEMAALEQAWSDYSTEKADIDAMTNADKFTSIYNSVANGSIDLAGAQNLAAKYGITLSEADIAMLQGASDRHQAGVTKSDNAYKMDVLGSFYNQILNGMSVEEAMAAIEGYGIALSESDKTYLNGAAGRYANNKADLDEREANAQALNFLSMAKSGEWSAEELAVLAEKAGLGVAYTTTEINENGEEVTREVTWAEFIGDVARATATAQGDEEKQNSLIKITELAVNGVSAGGLEVIAEAYGLNTDEIAGVLEFANNAAAEKTAAQQKATAYQLMEFAQSGDFSAEELASLAAMEGLDQVVAYTKDGKDVTWGDIISELAENTAEVTMNGYRAQLNTWIEEGMSSSFIEDMAEMWGLSDEYAEEVKGLATREGEAKEDAEKAEKANKLISLIAEASNGASAATIKALAEAMGLEYDDYKAAMDIASGLEAKRQNSAYAELMSQLGDDVAAIDAMVERGDITYQQGVSLKQNVKYNDISNDIQVNGIFAEIPMADIVSSDNFMGSTLDQVGPVAPGDVRITLTDEQVDELVNQWNTAAQDELSGLITSAQGGGYPSTEDMQRMIEALENSYVNDYTKEKFVNLIKELMGHNPIAFKKNYEDIDFSAFVNIDYTYGIPIIVPDDGGDGTTNAPTLAGSKTYNGVSWEYHD